MLTDRPPRSKKLRAQFVESDRLRELALPDDRRLRELARAIEEALTDESRAACARACTAFVEEAARIFDIPPPEIKVLAARPQRVYSDGTVELYGDYNPETQRLRVWMRTAVKKKVTSYGTFLSTLVHEFCHHLDMVLFGFEDSPHTRGFYERTACLYHHARGTPRKRLSWIKLPRGGYRIDWTKMRASRAPRPSRPPVD